MNSDQFSSRARGPRLLVALCALGASLVLVAGCSGGGAKEPAGDAAPREGAPKQNGPMFAECAGLSPQEVAQRLGETSARVQFRNSVTCVWLLGGGSQASFTWYRGSPIGREESWEGKTRDDVQRVKIGGYPGFMIYQQTGGQGLCELGADFGNDFIEWSVELGSRSAGQGQCAGTRQLAELSIERAKK